MYTHTLSQTSSPSRLFSRWGSGLGLCLVIFFSLAYPPPVGADTTYDASNTASEYGTVNQNNVPYVGADACGPTSAINSYTYLQNQYPVYNNSLVTGNPISDVQVMANKFYMKTDLANGTWFRDYFWGKNLYMENIVPLQTAYAALETDFGSLSPSNGGWSDNRPKPTWVTYMGNTTNVYSAYDTWNFIYLHLKNHDDVGIGIQYLSGGGHFLSVIGFSFTDTNGDKKIQKDENATLTLMDPWTGSITTCHIWNDPDHGDYLIMDIYCRENHCDQALIQLEMAEYPQAQSVPTSVDQGNIWLLHTTSPYGNLTLNGGVLLLGDPQVTWSKNFTLTAGTASVLDTSELGYTGTLTGSLAGSGGLTQKGTGTIILQGNSAGFSGTYALDTGTLLLGSSAALGTGGLTITGGTFGSSAPGISATNAITVGGSFNLGTTLGNDLTLSSNLALGGHTLTHTGPGTDTLSGNLTSTTSGGVTVSAGTLNLTGNNAAYPGTSTVTGGTLNLQGAGDYTGNNTVSGGILNLNSASVITYSGDNTVTGGTLNMSSAGSTYSGASNVTGGALNLSAGTLAGLLTLNGGAFNLSGTGTYTNAAPLTNSAGSTLNIAAGNTLTLLGGLTSNGNTTVNGTLTGDLTNGVGGTLKGDGTINGKVTSSGTISPGNSPGIMIVSGSYTQTASGTYRAEVASPSSYDQIVVTPALPLTGTASLAGTITPILLGGYRPLAHTVFSGLVTATGGITGTFNPLTNPFFAPTLFWQPRYSANSFDLFVQRDYTNAGLSLNSNQLAVGTMLNGLASATSGDLNTVMNAIDSLPVSANVQDAFKQISPEKAGTLTSLGFAAATFQMRNLATRTTNLRFAPEGSGGSSSLNPGGLSFNYSKLEGVMLAYNGASLSNLFSARKEFNAPESRWGLFADGGAAFGSQKTTVNQTGYNFTLGGLTAGADYRLRDNLLLGLSTGYSHTSSGFYGSGGSVNANTVPFNAYAAYFPGSLYAYGSLGYALNLYDLKRGINFGGLARTARSSTTGHQFNLYGETGYDLKLGRFILTPSATLANSTLWVGGFTEQDAGALNLKVASQTAASLQTGLGGRVTVPVKAGSVQVVPQGYAFYQHEFANGSRGLNASLSQGSSTFNFQTDAAKRNFAVVGANVTVGLTKNLYAQVNYNAEVGRGNYSAQSVNAGLRLEF